MGSLMSNECLQYNIVGNLSGQTIVLIHGWPDDFSLWDYQVPCLQENFRCVLVTLPNFGTTVQCAGGYSFQELIQMLDRTIETVQPEGKVLILAHDWGCYIGYLYERLHSNKIDRMVMLDVGGHLISNPVAGCMIICYQWTLILLWFLGGVLPRFATICTKRFAQLLQVPQKQVSQLKSSWNYPYAYLWKAIFFPWLGDYKVLLLKYKPSVPILYMYGTKKPLMFHSKKWLRIVEEKRGRNVQVEGGHWFMRTHPGLVNTPIVEWFSV